MNRRIPNLSRVFQAGAYGRPNGGASPLLTDLVAYWKLEDVNDAHTNGLTLTNNNSVTFGAGKVNNAGTFVAASSQYLSIADTSLLRPGNFDFTYSVWFKLTNTATTRMLVSKDDSSSRGIQIYCDAATFRCTVWLNNFAGTTASSAVTLSSGTWYHAAVWHDSAGDTVNVRINDGTTYSASTSGSAPQASTAEFDIGRDSYVGFPQYMNGQIDEVGYWTRVLTADEITQLYNSGSGVTYPTFA